MDSDNIWKHITVKGSIILAVAGIIYFVLGKELGQPVFEFYSDYVVVSLIMYVAIIIGFIGFCKANYKKDIKGEHTPVNECVHIFDKYDYLLEQLITRDFAVKYRRSYLGIVWVLLNPLFQMILLSAVFSFIFRFDIVNYPVYLILGQVTYNFFSEATGVAVTTVVDSGQLIKKVYMPKFIFPLSKIVFSFLNFFLSFIPVIVVLIIFRIPVNINWLYLPIFFVTLFMFTLGVGFFLSALNVKMRDTQYLYGIFITLLNYITPVFYPVSALSPRFRVVMRFNPMYQFISLLREIIFENVTPSIQHLLICFTCGILALVIGMRFFFRQQDEFILYV